MRLGAPGGVLGVSDKSGRQERHGLCATDGVIVQKPVESRAQANSPSFQPRFNTIGLGFHEEISFRLRAVLASITSGLIRSMAWVERKHIHRAGRIHGEVDVVRHDPLIVFRQTPLKSHPLRVQVVVLMLLTPNSCERITSMQNVRFSSGFAAGACVGRFVQPTSDEICVRERSETATY